jgi:chromatin remodeling complex protein RSC6
MSTKVATSKTATATAATPRVKKTAVAPAAPVAESATPAAPVKKTKAAPVATKAEEPAVVVQPEVAEEAKNLKKFTSEDVIAVVNSAILKLKEESALAKTRKDKVSSSNLNELVKSLNSIKKPIDKLARSKPPRKQINIDGNRNGFLKPVPISDELAKFLDCEPGSMKSRVEVTRAICEYIDKNKLQHPANRREIVVDPVLQKLLSYDPAVETTPLQYYIVQSRIQRHFVKSVATV